MGELDKSYLPKLEQTLAGVVGDDLAHTLVLVAQRRDSGLDLETQLMINDGLCDMSPEQRAEILALLDGVEAALDRDEGAAGLH